MSNGIELSACIVAGRRAALAEIIRLGATTPGWNYAGRPFESMVDEASTRITINGADVTSAFDAAVLEVIAWKAPAAPPKPKRPWWRFW